VLPVAAMSAPAPGMFLVDISSNITGAETLNPFICFIQSIIYTFGTDLSVLTGSGMSWFSILTAAVDSCYLAENL